MAERAELACCPGVGVAKCLERAEQLGELVTQMWQHYCVLREAYWLTRRLYAAQQCARNYTNCSAPKCPPVSVQHIHLAYHDAAEALKDAQFYNTQRLGMLGAAGAADTAAAIRLDERVPHTDATNPADAEMPHNVPNGEW